MLAASRATTSFAFRTSWRECFLLAEDWDRSLSARRMFFVLGPGGDKGSLSSPGGEPEVRVCFASCWLVGGVFSSTSINLSSQGMHHLPSLGFGT